VKLAPRRLRTLKQRAAATRQEIMRILACYEEILKEKRGLCLTGFQYLIFLKSSSQNPISPPVLLDIGHDDPDDPPTGQEEVPL
jgi:hypothetical protein